MTRFGWVNYYYTYCSTEWTLCSLVFVWFSMIFLSFSWKNWALFNQSTFAGWRRNGFLISLNFHHKIVQFCLVNRSKYRQYFREILYITVLWILLILCVFFLFILVIFASAIVPRCYRQHSFFLISWIESTGRFSLINCSYYFFHMWVCHQCW